MDNNEEYLELLQQQVAMLANIADILKAPKLGFGSAPSLLTVYCNRTNGGLWYSLREGKEPEVIEHNSITGYVEDLKFEKVERRGKETTKLHLYLRGDRPYRLESGFDSAFSKGLLICLASMRPVDLRFPLTISPQAGDDEAVLFCRCYIGSTQIRPAIEWNEETNWRQVSQMAINHVRGIHNASP